MNNRRFTRRNFLRTTRLALPLVAGCVSTNHHPRAGRTRKDDFVSVRDARFMLRGRPYNYVGTNLWFGCYLSDATLPGGRARLVRELDRLQRTRAINTFAVILRANEKLAALTK